MTILVLAIAGLLLVGLGVFMVIKPEAVGGWIQRSRNMIYGEEAASRMASMHSPVTGGLGFLLCGVALITVALIGMFGGF